MEQPKTQNSNQINSINNTSNTNIWSVTYFPHQNILYLPLVFQHYYIMRISQLL
jgi:hypothetical protein